MAKSRDSGQRQVEIELRPDGWERFEKAIDAAIKTPAKPKDAVPGRAGRERSVRLLCHANDFFDALSQLRSELDRDLPRHLREIALGFLEHPEELVRVETELNAAATGDLTVRFEPSDRLRMLLTTLRARDIDRLIVEKSGHG
jgi:hypothetical protein